MIEIIGAIIEAIISALAAIVEAIASLFTAGGEALGAGEALIVLALFFLELLLWGFLVIFELVVALFRWRGPKRVPKPIIWRPKKSGRSQAVSQEVGSK